jgi:hypothetical protein
MVRMAKEEKVGIVATLLVRLAWIKSFPLGFSRFNVADLRDKVVLFVNQNCSAPGKGASVP